MFKPVGSIVATDRDNGLKVVFHVLKEGGSVRFTTEAQPDWHHLCHSSHSKNSAEWLTELGLIGNGYDDAEYYEIKK